MKYEWIQFSKKNYCQINTIVLLVIQHYNIKYQKCFISVFVFYQSCQIRTELTSCWTLLSLSLIIDKNCKNTIQAFIINLKNSFFLWLLFRSLHKVEWITMKMINFWFFEFSFKHDLLSKHQWSSIHVQQTVLCACIHGRYAMILMFLIKTDDDKNERIQNS